MKTKLVLFCFILVITACGKSSDPLAKYPGLKAQDPSDQKSQQQTVVQPDLFSFKVSGSNEINSAQFVEGSESAVQIQVAPKSDLISQFQVELLDFPTAERPSLAPGPTEGIWTLTWRPPIGTIQAGLWGQSFLAQIRITVVQSKNELLVGATNLKALDVVVNRNGAQPKLLGHSDLSGGVSENKSQEFTVDVEDPGTTSSPKLPELQITPYIYANTEAYRADGSRYLIYDDQRSPNPEKIAADQWRFYYRLEIDHLPLDRDRLGHEIPAATAVDMCFHIRAVSVVGTLSEQQQICARASYEAQPAIITLQNEASLLNIKAGIASVFTFDISAAHPLSHVTVKSTDTMLSDLSGQKAIHCEKAAADKDNHQICVLTWTPSCVKDAVATIVYLNAEASLDSKVKTSRYSKSITVLPNPEACPAPTPAAANKGMNK